MGDEDRLLDGFSRLVRRLLERADAGDDAKPPRDVLAAHLGGPPERMPLAGTPARVATADLLTSRWWTSEHR